VAKSSPKTLTSIRQLAEAVKRSHVAVGRWVKRDDWTFGRGPWRVSQVPAIVAWAKRELAENPANDERTSRAGGSGEDQAESLRQLSPLKKIDAALKLSRKSRVDFDLDVDKGVYHRVDECRRQRLRQIHEVKTALMNMPDGLPVDTDVKTMIKGRVLEILRKWSSPDSANTAPAPHAAAVASPVAH